MMKMENGSHFGRHLEFRRELQGDIVLLFAVALPGLERKSSFLKATILAYLYKSDCCYF